MSLPPWVPSPDNIVRKMLQTAQVGQEDVVCDLGSGDGRILIAAVQDFKAKKAIGYEILEHLYQTSLQEIEKRKLGDKIELHKGNLYEADLTEASVVTLYLSHEVNELLRPKLEKELRHGTRVVCLISKINNWQPSALAWGGEVPHFRMPPVYGCAFIYYPIYLYTIPDAFEVA